MILCQMPRSDSETNNSPGKIAQVREFVEVGDMRIYFLRVGAAMISGERELGIHMCREMAHVKGFGSRRHW